MPEPATISLAAFTVPSTLNATACYSCGAAAVHAMGVPGLRAAQAWIEAHHAICPERKPVPTSPSR